MIDFFCKSMAASNFCNERKSALTFEFPIFRSYAVFCRPLCMLNDSSKKNQTVGGQIKIYLLFRLVYVIF